MDKYFYLAKLNFIKTKSNKPLIIGLNILLVLLLLTYNQLWIVIGSQEDKIINISFIWYLLFAEMIILSPPRMDRILSEDIRTGTMTYFINKPISFFLMRICEAIGEMSATFFFMILIGGTSAYIITGGIPFNIAHLPIIVLMVYLSTIINIFMKASIGMCALWLANTRYLNLVIERLAFIFGGAIIPLSIYPDWFVSIAKFTPFYAFYYMTIRLVYDFSIQNLITAISLNAMWFIIIGTFIAIAYKKLNRNVEIYGG